MRFRYLILSFERFPSKKQISFSFSLDSLMDIESTQRSLLSVSLEESMT